MLYLRKTFMSVVPGRLKASIIILCISLLASLSHANEEWKHLVAPYAITDIEVCDNGYWFATAESGALRYDTQMQQWYRYNKNTGHMNQNHTVNDMKIVSERVWFATNYGMYSCDPDGRNWEQHVLPGGIYANWVRGLDGYGDTLWIAAFTGLHSYSISGSAFSAHDIALPDNYQTSYTSCIAAADSVVWIGTDDGVFRYDTSLPVSDPASRSYYGKGSGFDTASDLVMCRTIRITPGGVWFGLDEYTPSNAPNYCLGGLFQKRGDQWNAYDRNTGFPAGGVHFIRQYGHKIYAGLFRYIDGVNFEGAGLLEIDLQDSSHSILFSGENYPGTDDVRAFYCENGDTLLGTETGLYTNAAGLREMKPYKAPEGFSVRNIGNAMVEVRIDTVRLANAYQLNYSTDNISYNDSLVLDSPCDTVTCFTPGEKYFFRVAAMNASGRGPFCSDILGCTVSEDRNPFLIVQAFQKTTIENQYDHVVSHGNDLFSHNTGYDAASVFAVRNGSVSFEDYEAVDWIGGLDQESLDEVTMPLIAAYLENGGKLFISGSYIQEDLYGSSAGRSFNKNYLKAEVKKLDTDRFRVQPLHGGIFEGLEVIAFGDGEEAAYTVYRPDGFHPRDGAESSLFYSGADSSVCGSAALHYRGSFADAERQGALVYLGFPFETVYPDSLRNAMMGCILDYFDFDVQLTSVKASRPVTDFRLEQNYPNPFNGETRIRFSIHAPGPVNVSVYTVSGQKAADLTDRHYDAGTHTLHFRAGSLPSGIYLCRLQAGGRTQTRKMLLLR
ncbi:MAG: T9SS type A sorting domain-containing protein [Fidelibacterota bacterium]